MARSDKPPVFNGAIRSIEDLRDALAHQLWAVETAIEVTPKDNPSYLRGKRSVLRELLARLDWPDQCEKCGASPVVDTIEDDVLCADCISAWMDNQDLVDGETA